MTGPAPQLALLLGPPPLAGAGRWQSVDRLPPTGWSGHILSPHLPEWCLARRTDHGWESLEWRGTVTADWWWEIT